MRISSDINDKAMAQFKAIVHEGVTEKELADQMLKIYTDLGADGYSFEPLVAFGANAADPHHEPDNTVLKVGDCVLFDVGCIRKGYCSDMTRTVAIGEPTEEMKKVYHIVLEAQLAGIAAAKAGVPGVDIHMAAQKVIADAGYGAYFGHGFGHSVGIEIHENPNANLRNKEPLPVGAAISAEPGIYLPGRFGVRIEDVLVLTETGNINLTKAPKELIIL